MIDSLLQDIHHPDPQVRGEAIIRLANLRDTAVLPALADVHRNDPDPRLRNWRLSRALCAAERSPADRRPPRQRSRRHARRPDAASEAAAAAADAGSDSVRATCSTRQPDITTRTSARAIESLGRALTSIRRW